MLRIEGLKVTFPGSPMFTAVDGVDLHVPTGSTVGLVGESGSGKSTLARSVVGLNKVSAGSIRVMDRDVTNASGWSIRALRRQVQLVFQDPYASLNPRMDVGMAVQEAVSIEKRSRIGSRPTMNATLELFDLVGVPTSAMARYPHQLSGGQLQRIAIARALALKPRLILLDEVTASLDVSVQAKILNLLRRVQRDLELSILYISHDLSVVRYLCDRLYVMRDGRVVESGLTEEVFLAPAESYTRNLLDAVPTLGGRRWRDESDDTAAGS